MKEQSYNDLIEQVRYWRRCALSAADMHAATAQGAASASRTAGKTRARLTEDCEAVISLLDGQKTGASSEGRIQAVRGRIERAQRALVGRSWASASGERELPGSDDSERVYLTGLESSRELLASARDSWRGVTCEIAAMVAESMAASDLKTVSKSEKRRQSGIGANCLAMLDVQYGPRNRSAEKVRARLERAALELGGDSPRGPGHDRKFGPPAAGEAAPRF